MNHIEIVAAQRDELAMKLRELSMQLDTAKAEIAMLREALARAAPAPVPSASPPKLKKPRIFGGGA